MLPFPLCEMAMTSDNEYESPKPGAVNNSVRGGVAAWNIAFAGGSSFALGFAVWACSRLITGTNEPWDSPYPFYSSSMVIGGIVVGFVAPNIFVIPLFGVWLGQVLALATIPWLADAGWLSLGVIATAIGSFLLLPGLFLGMLIRNRIR